ncbi:hypothetical protein [uncultured Rhodospira sp.]|uniref:hypothetical protein n=1 Tax=uncultured Rhodospira sp. TaxID=1936189 RepID=UPI0026236D61|nr:hypothetical protein [uncultured Rhodospira sp.]
MAIEISNGVYQLVGDTEGWDGAAQQVIGSPGNNVITVDGGSAFGAAGSDQVTVRNGGAYGTPPALAGGPGDDLVVLESMAANQIVAFIKGDGDLRQSGQAGADHYVIGASVIGDPPDNTIDIVDLRVPSVLDDFARIIQITDFEPQDTLTIGGIGAGSVQAAARVPLYDPVVGVDQLGLGTFLNFGDVGVQILPADGQHPLSTTEDFDDSIDFEGGDGLPTFADGPDDLPQEVQDAIYRFYNEATGTHFYSGTFDEAQDVATDYLQFDYEGVAYQSTPESDPDSTPLFRFYNTSTGTHFYTTSETERARVNETLPQFNDEGVAYHVHEDPDSNDVALHRFYNTQTQTHFYTASETEKDSVVDANNTFTYEGVVGYVDPA